MEKELSLLELIDIDTMQRFQDVLHSVFGISTGLADKEGVALDSHDSWTEFCGGCIKKSTRGLAMCENCDKQGMLSAMEYGTVMTYSCHTGLVDFAAPIVVDGKAVGCFLGGQVTTSPLTREHVNKLARRYEIDPEKLWEAAQKIPVVSEEQVERAANLVYEISNLISRLAYQRYELQITNTEIEKVANMKSDFLANMSHEIRTPMNAVIGMAEMALREEMTPAAKEYVNQIIASGKTLLTIINDILDFSKIESGKMEIHDDEYELMSVIYDVANMIMTRIEDKELELILDIDPTLPRLLWGDMIRINQVITNLANNAVKFTNEGCVKLQVAYEKIMPDEVLLKISVKDTGIGIRPADLERLFQSFTQVDSKRNRNIEGTGLGLALSKQLLELMDGSIHVESEYGVGSTFSFTLPQKIVDSTESIPVIETEVITVGLVDNSYVEHQLQTDVQRLNGTYQSLDSEEALASLEGSGVTHLFVERELFTEVVENFIREHKEISGVVLIDFRDSLSYDDIPNLRIIKKPLYVMNVSSILKNEKLRTSAFSHDEEHFEFIAPEARILIVDDNNVNLTVAEGLLEPLQMKIDTATGGKQALDLISANSYDLIFMDHMMPELDGVETTRLIRRFHPEYHEVPIIALTANAVEGTKKMFLDEGMNDFIAKPIEMRIMLSKLKYWLPKEKIQKQVQSEDEPNSEPVEKIHIDGLDTEYALRLLGSEKLYMNVLKNYYIPIDKKAALIKELEEKEDWPAYTIEVHALKSASRQIGAIELADLAAALEAASNARDTEMIRNHSDEMIIMYCSMKDILRPYIPVEEEVQTEGVIEQSELLGLFHDMRDAMDELDFDQMEDVVHELQRYEYDEEQKEFLEQLKEAAESIDIDACEAIISQWESVL